MPELQREARHDLAAFVKSFWAVRFDKVTDLNAIQALDFQVMCFEVIYSNAGLDASTHAGCSTLVCCKFKQLCKLGLGSCS